MYRLPPGEWSKYFNKISKLFYNINQSTYGYSTWSSRWNHKPSPFLQLHNRDEKYRHFLSCLPNRYGKDYASAAEAAGVLFLPNRHILLVGSLLKFSKITFSWMLSFIMPIIRKFRIPHMVSRSQVPRLVLYPNTIRESWVTCSSFKNIGSLEGEECDLIVICEAGDLATKFEWITEKMSTRLANRKGSWILQSTNDARNPNFRTFVYDNMNREDVFYIGPLSPHAGQEGWTAYDNPYIDLEEIEINRRILPAHVFAEKYLGQFVSLKGRAIDGYDALLHRISKNKLPFRDSNIVPPAYAGLDFGANDDTSLVIGTFYQGKHYILKVFTTNNKPITDIIPKIKEYILRYNIKHIYCDTQKQLWLELQKEGIPSSSANKMPLYNSVLNLSYMFRQGMINLVEEDTIPLHNELLLYDWSEKRNVPIDRNNHSIDGLRYLVDSVPMAKYFEAVNTSTGNNIFNNEIMQNDWFYEADRINDSRELTNVFHSDGPLLTIEQFS